MHLFPSDGVSERFSCADDLKVNPLEKTSAALSDEKIRAFTKRRKKVTGSVRRAHSAETEGCGPGRTPEKDKNN